MYLLALYRKSVRCSGACKSSINHSNRSGSFENWIQYGDDITSFDWCVYSYFHQKYTRLIPNDSRFCIFCRQSCKHAWISEEREIERFDILRIFPNANIYSSTTLFQKEISIIVRFWIICFEYVCLDRAKIYISAIIACYQGKWKHNSKESRYNIVMFSRFTISCEKVFHTEKKWI